MRNRITALLAGLTLSLLAVAPVSAQIFRQPLADKVYQENIPEFRRMGLMPQAADVVNLDVFALLAHKMASDDGSLKTLPADAQTKDGYMSFFRQKNDLTGQTMPFSDFRALVNGRGVYLLQANDFAPAPATAQASPPPPPPAASAPVTTVATAPAETLESLRQKVVALEQSAGKLSAAQAAALGDFKRQLVGLESQRQRINELASSSNTNAGNIATLKTEQAAFAGQLQTATTTFQTLEGKIAGLDRRLTSVEGRLDNHDSRISNLERFGGISPIIGLLMLLALIGIVLWVKLTRVAKPPSPRSQKPGKGSSDKGAPELRAVGT